MALLELHDVEAATARSRRCTASRSRSRRARPSRCSARTAPGRRRRCARSPARCGRRGEIVFDGKRIARRAARVDRAARDRPRARGPRDLRRADRLGERAPRRRRSGATARAVKRDAERGARVLPADRRAARSSRPGRCPAASSRCSRSPARSSRGRGCCCSTSPRSASRRPSSASSSGSSGTLNQEEGLTVLVVEQNARIALASTQHATCSRSGASRCDGTSEELARHEGVRASYLGY